MSILQTYIALQLLCWGLFWPLSLLRCAISFPSPHCNYGAHFSIGDRTAIMEGILVKWVEARGEDIPRQGHLAGDGSLHSLCCCHQQLEAKTCSYYLSIHKGLDSLIQFWPWIPSFPIGLLHSNIILNEVASGNIAFASLTARALRKFFIWQLWRWRLWLWRLL